MQELLFILGLVLLNGVFSGAEIAILSLRRSRLEALAAEGSRAARAVLALRDQPDRFLATVQIGITVVSALAAALGGSSVAERLAPLIALVPPLAPFADQIALGLVVAAVSALSLVLGELVPKSLALRHSEGYALFMGPVLRGLASLARPAVWALTGASNLVLRLFSDHTSFSEARLSREELLQLMDEAAVAGAVDPHAGEIASRALAFEQIDAHDMMVPRREIQAVPRGASVADLAALARGGSPSRLPVYERELDNLLGYLNLAEVLGHAQGQADYDWSAHLHPLHYVAETMRAPQLLRALQGSRRPLAVVVDEQGSVRGLVTMEDLIEELVGEITSENDAAPEQLAWGPDGTVLVRGGAAVHELRRALDAPLPEGQEWSTVAGLCIHLAGGRIPAPGERLDAAPSLQIEIVEASPRRVRQVLLRRRAPLTTQL